MNHTDGWDIPMTCLWRWGQLDYARINPVGWVAGDNDKSVLLPDGSVLWLFNDSWAEKLNFYSNVPGGGPFLRNCATHQVGTNLDTLSNSTFFVPTNPADLFWIGDAVIESTQVKVLLSEINATAIRRVGTAIGTLSLPSLTLESITPIPGTGADDYNQVLNGNEVFITCIGPPTPRTIRSSRRRTGCMSPACPWVHWQTIRPGDFGTAQPFADESFAGCPTAPSGFTLVVHATWSKQLCVRLYAAVEPHDHGAVRQVANGAVDIADSGLQNRRRVG